MDIDELPSARAAMLCWTPGTDQVAIVPWPDLAGFGDRYKRSTLACNVEVATMDREKLKALCFIEAMHLIARDGCCPVAVHLALCGIREYRDGLSVDTPTSDGVVGAVFSSQNRELRDAILAAIAKNEDGIVVGKLSSVCRPYRDAKVRNRDSAIKDLIKDGSVRVVEMRGRNGKMCKHLMKLPLRGLSP